MKILLATGIYPPSIGGPATYAKILSDELPPRGVDVKVCSFDTFRRYPKIIRHFLYFLYVCLNTSGCKIVYALDPVSVGLPALFAARLLRKKFVMRIGGDYAWEQSMMKYGITDTLDIFIHKRYGWRVRLLKGIQKYTACRARFIITPSEYLKGIIVAWGVPASSVVVINNFVNSQKISPVSREELRSRFGWNTTVIVSAGRLIPLKGFEGLLRTLQRLDAKYHLIIVGSGPLEQKLHQSIQDKNLSDRVKLLPSIKQDLLFDYMRAADVFILNTSSEGFSNTLIEAMAQEVPVVATRPGSNSELIAHGKSGLLFEFDNVPEMKAMIETVCTDARLAQTCTQNAKASLFRFNKDVLLDKLIKQLQTL